MEYVKDLRKLVGTRPLILVGAAVLVFNEKEELLLQQRPDGEWGLPGGLMDLGESLEDTARREVQEETGLLLGKLRFQRIFSGPEFYIKLPNGDQFYSVTALYESNDIVGGSLKVDGIESIQVSYFPIEELPKEMKKNFRTYIECYLKGYN
ncbi:NUDIX hydrolase [Evansella sp. AB-rgal1]|uniref:NUDIX hydrolase n=1 Tax=Evansella sp. AB-rgal1 TaxID=3242696 RepID=UPI00359D5EF1